MWRAGAPQHPVVVWEEMEYRDWYISEFFSRTICAVAADCELAACVGYLFRLSTPRGDGEQEDALVAQLDLLLGYTLRGGVVEALTTYVTAVLRAPTYLATSRSAPSSLEELVARSCNALVALVAEFGEDPVAWALVEDLSRLRGRGNEATYLDELLPVVRGLMCSRVRDSSIAS
jgi:hypothetical protein